MGWLSRASIYVAMSLPFKLQFAQGASRSIRAPHPFTSTPRTTPIPVTAEKEEGDTSLPPTQVLAPRLSQAAVWGNPCSPGLSHRVTRWVRRTWTQGWEHNVLVPTEPGRRGHCCAHTRTQAAAWDLDHPERRRLRGVCYL